MSEAESRLGPGAQGTPGAFRPEPGVYRYTGAGTDRLSMLSLSQRQGPSLPGTVTLEGSSCWVFKMDFSTHHWQSWRYCRHGDDLWEASGQTWQLWSIGPVQVTNLTTMTCRPGSMALPGKATLGQQWQAKCSGTSTTVKGRVVSEGPYRLVGLPTLRIGGEEVQAAHFLRLRTDSGAQKGEERSEVWLDRRTGLPLRAEQSVKVVTATPFGSSRYTQVGHFQLRSLTPHR